MIRAIRIKSLLINFNELDLQKVPFCAYPFEIDWNVAYRDPTQPLVVDIGSGFSYTLLVVLFCII